MGVCVSHLLALQICPVKSPFNPALVLCKALISFEPDCKDWPQTHFLRNLSQL